MTWWSNFYNAGGGIGGQTTIVLTQEIDVEVDVNQIQVDTEIQPLIVGVDFAVQVNQVEINFDISCQ